MALDAHSNRLSQYSAKSPLLAEWNNGMLLDIGTGVEDKCRKLNLSPELHCMSNPAFLHITTRPATGSNEEISLFTVDRKNRSLTTEAIVRSVRSTLDNYIKINGSIDAVRALCNGNLPSEVELLDSDSDGFLASLDTGEHFFEKRVVAITPPKNNITARWLRESRKQVDKLFGSRQAIVYADTSNPREKWHVPVYEIREFTKEELVEKHIKSVRHPGQVFYYLESTHLEPTDKFDYPSVYECDCHISDLDGKPDAFSLSQIIDAIKTHQDNKQFMHICIYKTDDDYVSVNVLRQTPKPQDDDLY